jgi:hypothetical protein
VSKRRDDGQVAWKRDPKLVNGFVAADLWRFVKEIEARIITSPCTWPPP